MIVGTMCMIHLTSSRFIRVRLCFMSMVGMCDRGHKSCARTGLVANKKAQNKPLTY